MCKISSIFIFGRIVSLNTLLKCIITETLIPICGWSLAARVGGAWSLSVFQAFRSFTADKGFTQTTSMQSGRVELLCCSLSIHLRKTELCIIITMNISSRDACPLVLSRNLFLSKNNIFKNKKDQNKLQI